MRVTAEVNGALPNVRGDRERLRQVVQNLLDNAVKYSPAGGEVQVRATADDGRVLVEVEDAGPGISLEDQQLIFAKFGRAATDGGGKPGTGLGLFIARTIAEAHGGSVEVDSVPARGSIFTLELPLGAGLGAGAQAGDAELVGELARAGCDCRAHCVRFEQDRLSSLREHFADQPFRAADRHLGKGGAVLQRCRSALGGPACATPFA